MKDLDSLCDGHRNLIDLINTDDIKFEEFFKEDLRRNTGVVQGHFEHFCTIKERRHDTHMYLYCHKH